MDIKDYMIEHDCSYEQAREALCDYADHIRKEAKENPEKFVQKSEEDK